MEFERVDRNGVTFYRVESGGFRGVFSTRVGGVSRGLCQSLNLGLTRKDTRENVLRNRRLFAEAAGFEAPKLLRQVHGATVIDVPAGETEGVQEGDALVSARPGRALGVLTADCLAVALWDPATRTAAVAHAGRKGMARGVVTATLRAMRGRYGSDPSRVHAFIGPGIGACCYEVSEEALVHIRANLPQWRDFVAPRGRGGKFLLDLRGLIQDVLEGAGVPADQISSAELCTACRPREFFSYRRDGPGAGRMMNAVWVEDGEPGELI